MTWTIAGTSSDVLIGVSAQGNATIRGEGSHTPYITEDWVSADYPAMAEALRRLMTVKADWRILSTDAVQKEIIDGAALLTAIESNSGKSVAAITCIDRENDGKPALSFNIALQPKTFEQVQDLFSKLVLGCSDIQYAISVDFFMFGSPGASTDIPTLEEFRSGRPYLSDEVSISARRPRQKDDA
jgi:hypothetical protein